MNRASRNLEAYSTQVMELLSLTRHADGRCRVEIGVIHGDRQGSFVMEIDEFTYLELEALQPLSGARVRISPYPKWDPYRSTHYSAIVRMNGVSQETLYFACSDAFAREIGRLRSGESPVALLNAATADTAVVRWGRRDPLLRRMTARAPRMAGRLLILCGMLAVLSIPTEEMGLSLGAADGTVNAIATEAEAGRAAEASDVPAAIPAVGLPAKAAAPVPAEPAPEPAPASAAPPPEDAPKHYEVMEIDGENKFYKLPKAYVALTFDDGPSAHTREIVDILTEQEVAATFLFVGRNVDKYPESVKYASEQGMSIGNHSWDHSMLTKAGAKKQSSNLVKTNKAIEALTDTPVTIFRPPYGAVNDTLVDTAKKQHLKTLLWNRDPEDWNAKKPDDILRYFRKVDAAGGVYVLHEDSNTVKALPDIIKYLKEQELTFVAFR